MAFETDPRARWAGLFRNRGFLSGRGRGRPRGVWRKREEGSLSPSVTTCGTIKGYYTISRLYLLLPCWVERIIAAAEPHDVHQPRNRRGGGPLRFSRRGLQKLHCAFGKTTNYRLKSLLTLGSVDLCEQQEEERPISSPEGRSGCPRKNRVQDTTEERR